jgi:hypothetical protein
MTIAIILHNIVIEVEGATRGSYFTPIHTRFEEQDDRGLADIARDVDDDDGGEQKRRTLVEELIAFREMQHKN